MKSETLSANGQRFFKLIVASLNLLDSLVNNLLDMKMIEADKFEMKREFFSLAAVMEYIVSIFEPQAQSQKTSIMYRNVSVSAHDTAIKH